MKDILTEVINNYINRNCVIKEYKNSNDSEIVRVCTDQLENLYNKILSDGLSRHEVTIEKLRNVIKELRKVQQMMAM